MRVQDTTKLRNREKRIGPLEVLPVFLKLEGKRVLVVGSSIGAVWKAELLLQAGAHLTAVCQQPSPQLFDLLSLECPGVLDIRTSDWRDVSFEGAALVIADVDDGDAGQLYEKGRRAAAIVNVIDKPEFCDIQFGAIVNHSPVVIGISTGGAAPVLAQLLRSIIETALPLKLQALAAKAQSIRPKINARLPTAEARRRYWGAFFERLQCLRTTVDVSPHHIQANDPQDLTVRDLAKLRYANHIYLLPGANQKIAQLGRREALRHSIGDMDADRVMSSSSVILGPQHEFQIG